MEIHCPNCGTRFRVDSSRLDPDGTRVRCSVCGNRFLAYPEAGSPVGKPEASLLLEELEPGPGGESGRGVSEQAPGKGRKGRKARGRTPRQAGSSRKGASWLLRFLVLLLFVGLVGELGYAFRSQWLGIPWARSIVERGLELARVDWELPLSLRHYRAKEVSAQLIPLASGRRITLLSGVLVNDAPFEQRAPNMELRAPGPGGKVRYRQVKEPGEPFDVTGPMKQDILLAHWEKARDGFPDRLGPGAEVPFVVLLEDVPAGVRRFQVEIVD